VPYFGEVSHSNLLIPDARFEVFMARKIQVTVFCIVMLCSDVVKMKAARSSKMLVSYHITKGNTNKKTII